jgi:eukaryotic-like serine/threonine-protein kinase
MEIVASQLASIEVNRVVGSALRMRLHSEQAPFDAENATSAQTRGACAIHDTEPERSSWSADTRLEAPTSRAGRDSGPAVQTGRSLGAFQPEMERSELAGNTLRLRRATIVASGLWPLFFSTDWLMANYVHRASFAAYAGIRAVVWALILIATLTIHRTKRPSRRMIIGIDTLVYGGASIAIALMCVLYGGLSSPYAAGIAVVLICRGAFVALPWRDALVPVALSTLSYPAILLGASFYSGGLSHSLADPAELSIFTFYTALLITTLFATLYGGQAQWALRLQVYEARNLGRYQLRRPIGKGGMGEVWAARHRTLKRDVAVKILRSDRFSEVARTRFEREVQATTELTHPNTVRVFDYGQTEDGLWYYVMELLDGEDLARAVSREGAFEPARAVYLMLQVCGALAEAHALGIVHRDLKPENVFLCRAGGVPDFVKVLDFGIAKRASEGTSVQLTHVDRVVGTPAYMSPEVALGGVASTRSDVYGLGGLFYFLLTGAAPFEASGDTAQLIARTVLEPLSPSLRRGQDLAPEIERVVMRCLSKCAEQRYRDASELLEALRAVAHDAGTARHLLR